MSYSRWSDSRWYTFWDVSSSNTRDGQVFNVCTVGSFTYKQLKDDIRLCLRLAKEEDKASWRDIEELRGYMEQFLRDVELEYPSE